MSASITGLHLVLEDVSISDGAFEPTKTVLTYFGTPTATKGTEYTCPISSITGYVASVDTTEREGSVETRVTLLGALPSGSRVSEEYSIQRATTQFSDKSFTMSGVTLWDVAVSVSFRTKTRKTTTWSAGLSGPSGSAPSVWYQIIQMDVTATSKTPSDANVTKKWSGGDSVSTPFGSSISPTFYMELTGFSSEPFNNSERHYRNETTYGVQMKSS